MANEIVLKPEALADNPFDPSPSFQMMQNSLDKLADAAKVTAVYAEPIKHGDTVVIPSAEVLTGFALGFGMGGGKDQNVNTGGGGGGRSLARPVAAIVITPNAVRVEPIVDVTKIALAAFTTAGFMLAMIARMSRRRAPRFVNKQY
ncbi:hypothetical protein ANRL3_01352 [Anaerolineae bacterium]|nr:hypothetical protein ANRL3_01352 [Anaerolineae bacterium]